MLEEKEPSSCSAYLVPVLSLLLASSFLNMHFAQISFLLYVNAAILLVFSYLWDFKGLAFSTVCMVAVFLWRQPQVFTQWQSLIFLLISVNCGFLSIQLQRRAFDFLQIWKDKISGL